MTTSTSFLILAQDELWQVTKNLLFSNPFLARLLPFSCILDIQGILSHPVLDLRVYRIL